MSVPVAQQVLIRWQFSLELAPTLSTGVAAMGVPVAASSFVEEGDDDDIGQGGWLL